MNKSVLKSARERPWTGAPAYWTLERRAQLAAQNKAARAKKAEVAHGSR